MAKEWLINNVELKLLGNLPGASSHVKLLIFISQPSPERTALFSEEKTGPDLLISWNEVVILNNEEQFPFYNFYFQKGTTSLKFLCLTDHSLCQLISAHLLTFTFKPTVTPTGLASRYAFNIHKLSLHHSRPGKLVGFVERGSDDVICENLTHSP